MSWCDKVVWSEGMFLRSQHFQQQERHFEFQLHARARMLSAHYWGFRTLELDESALALGVVALRRADGVFPDGTVFDLPEHGPVPVDLDFPPEHQPVVVCLALPPSRPGVATVDFDGSEHGSARHGVMTAEIGDCNSVGGPPAEIQLGELRPRLLPESAVPGGWNRIGVVRVLERQANRALVIDRDYIPPVLCSRRQEVLAGAVREVAGLLVQRGEALAQRMTAPGRGGIAEISDFLLLQVVNQWQPLLGHFMTLDGLHPERLYSALLALAGVLASYSATTRRPPDFPRYDHDDLATTFRAVITSLRQSLSMVLDQAAVRIELRERNYGVHVAQVDDRALFASASFVLAVRADMPAEQLRTQLPAQIKIGPVEKIRDLVNLHLPGIPLQPLPVAPRELPWNAGYNYFQLEAGHEFWREISRGGGFALHIAGSVPGVGLECWAIRHPQ